MRVELEWGAEGINALGPTADVIVIVDVLSFSTCVDVAVGRGATVYPYAWRDGTAERFAVEHSAQLATKRGDGGLSLSPASLDELRPGERVVLPSPNGSTLSLTAREHGIVLTGCLRNAAAVAHASLALGRSIAIVPAGERWASGHLRPALEDLLGAGAITSHFDSRHLSPDARAAAAAFHGARLHLASTLLNCPSGRELCDIGFQRDVEIAAMLDVSTTVPRLDGTHFHAFCPATA